MNEWPAERIQRLRELHAEGKTFAQISTMLDVSYGAIAGKCDRLGLKRREKKIKNFSEVAPLITPHVNGHKRVLYEDLHQAVRNTK